MSSPISRESAGESLRNSCHDFARSLARLPASIMEGFSRSMAAARRSRRPREIHHPPQNHHPIPLVPEELVFFAEFERRYGGHHPFFYGCRLAEALGIARREGKFVFVYLHDGDGGHPYTEQFCRRTLCSDVVVEFLDANFVSWGGVAGRGEGAGLVASLQPGSFPFCAVVSPVSDESIAVLQRIEGPVLPSELVEILQRTIDEQRSASRQSWPDELAAAVRASRAEEEERRRSALKLRQEQGAAYHESLRKDQEKERSRKSGQEGLGNAKSKVSTGLRPRYPGQAAREPSKTAQTRPPIQNGNAPSHRTEANTKIMIRFPNGERKQQAFHHTDTIREIYRYVDSLGIPGIGSYQFVRSYPRKTYGRQQLEMTLQDAGFHPSVTLYIEQLQ